MQQVARDFLFGDHGQLSPALNDQAFDLQLFQCLANDSFTDAILIAQFRMAGQMIAGAKDVLADLFFQNRFELGVVRDGTIEIYGIRKLNHRLSIDKT
nr:hypothetical protein [Longilinea arvoryzae]